MVQSPRVGARGPAVIIFVHMNWKLPSQREAMSLLEHILLRRGIGLEHRQGFLQPDLESLPDAEQIHDSVKAAYHILQFIKQGKRIAIHGDYDVDGVCSTALMWDFLYRELEADVIPFIPSRFDEGYGLSEPSLDAIVAAGAELVITVDCGIKNDDLVKQYAKRGLEFIITDHHSLPLNSKGKPFVPSKALAVVHPAHPKGNYPHKDICGAMVAWKLIKVIAKQAGVKDAAVNKYLDLVALATTCDLMPLQHENRTVVWHGLRSARQTTNEGLKALLTKAGVELGMLDTYHFGYVLGPRLNAAGRLDSAMDALRLLVTQSPNQAAELAHRLDQLNIERQRLTQQYIELAEQQFSAQANNSLIFVDGNEWPEGIVGLIAGKMAEKYNRPVIIGSVGEQMITASARSPKGFNLAAALEQVANLLHKYGGHAQAAGLTFAKQYKDELVGTLNRLAGEAFSDRDSFVPDLDIDYIIEPEDIQVAVVQQLMELGPFGLGNPAPIGAALQADLLAKQQIGLQGKHLKVSIRLHNQTIEAVHFGHGSMWDGIDVGATVDIAGELDVNEWRGNKRLQLKVKDVRKSV